LIGRKHLPKPNSGLDLILAFAIFAGIGLVVLYLNSNSVSQLEGKVQLIDGDSFRTNGQEVRLVGIDAPEGKQFCVKNKQKWRCGRESTRYLRRLISGKPVNCEGHEYDKFDRLLAKCHVNGVEINQMMVRNGWAVAFGDYRQEQADAKREKKGIWIGEFDFPQDWRRHNRLVDQWSR